MDEEFGRRLLLTFKWDDPATLEGERMVERVLDHRPNELGEAEFLTHWVGSDAAEATWEPTATFVTGCVPEWVEYCWENGVGVDLVSSLLKDREELEAGDE